MNTKLFHTGDLHYGRNGQLPWIDLAMTNAVDVAIAENCVAAVLAGDSFDHALNVHEPAFSAFMRQVMRLSSHMPTLVLAGTFSHDRPGSLDVLKDIPTKYPLIVADEIGVHDLAGVRVCVLPSLNKANPEVMKEGAHEWTRRQLAGFAQGNQDARSRGQSSVLVSHGTLLGAITESGYSMVSPDLEFSAENLAAADADAVLLAHIHRHAIWPNVLTPSGSRTSIAYPGSIARLVHGHTVPVGFLIVDLEPGHAATFEFHESPSRQFLEIDFPGLPDMDEIRHIAAKAGPDDAVRIRWTVDEEHAAAVDKQAIRDLFVGVDSLKLEPRVLPVQRVRAAGIGRAVTLADKLRHWAETTGSMEAMPRLLDRLEMVQAEDPEKIVGRIVL